MVNMVYLVEAATLLILDKIARDIKFMVIMAKFKDITAIKVNVKDILVERVEILRKKFKFVFSMDKS